MYTYHIHWSLDINRDNGWLCVLSFDQIDYRTVQVRFTWIMDLQFKRLCLYEARFFSKRENRILSLNTCAWLRFSFKVTPVKLYGHKKSTKLCRKSRKIHLRSENSLAPAKSATATRDTYALWTLSRFKFYNVKLNEKYYITISVKWNNIMLIV